MSKYALYHYNSCFYCQRVRQEIQALGLDVELRNIHEDKAYVQDLVDYDGRRTVPVLRIEQPDGHVDWLRESTDIVAYLRQKHGS